jgi:hypothetical protein
VLSSHVKRHAVVLALLFGLLGVAWSLVIPVGEAPDEGAHARFAEYLWTHRHLPNAVDVRVHNLAEGFQAPLYHCLIAALIGVTGYADSAMAWTPNPEFDNSGDMGHVNGNVNAIVRARSSPGTITKYHLLRLPNAVFGALAVWLMWLGLVRLGIREPTALLVTGLWASTAEATFMSGVIGNDMLATCLASLAFVFFATEQSASRLNWNYVLGLVALSLAIMAKMTVLFLWVGFAICAILWQRRAVVRNALMLLIPALLAGWSIVRSLSVHERKAVAERVVGLSNGLWPFAKSWIVIFVKTINATILSGVAMPGLANLSFPGWYHGLYVGIALVFAVAIAKAGRGQWNHFGRAASPYLIGFGILFLMSLQWFRESGETMASRLFYPYMPGLLIMCAVALNSLTGEQGPFLTRSRRRLFALCGIVVLILGLLPATLWKPIIQSATSWAQVQNPTSAYLHLLTRWFWIIGIAILMLAGWSTWGSVWIGRHIEDHSGRTSYFLYYPLMALNLFMLIFYVRPFFS